jgi:hypothetical protein
VLHTTIVKFQSDKASLLDAFKSFNVLGPTLAALEGLSSQEQTYLIMLAKYRFNFMYGDAHGIAYMLDPVYIGDGLPLPLRESIENTIFKHYFDDQPPSSEKQSPKYTKSIMRFGHGNCIRNRVPPSSTGCCLSARRRCGSSGDHIRMIGLFFRNSL